MSMSLKIYKRRARRQAELKAIIDANNNLVKRVMKARAQVLLTRLEDVCKACDSAVMENQVLKPLRAKLLAADSLEPFPESSFRQLSKTPV